MNWMISIHLQVYLYCSVRSTQQPIRWLHSFIFNSLLQIFSVIEITIFRLFDDYFCKNYVKSSFKRIELISYVKYNLVCNFSKRQFSLINLLTYLKDDNIDPLSGYIFYFKTSVYISKKNKRKMLGTNYKKCIAFFATA